MVLYSECVIFLCFVLSLGSYSSEVGAVASSDPAGAGGPCEGALQQAGGGELTEEAYNLCWLYV